LIKIAQSAETTIRPLKKQKNRISQAFKTKKEAFYFSTKSNQT
jgi:hypothetical protein